MVEPFSPLTLETEAPSVKEFERKQEAIEIGRLRASASKASRVKLAKKRFRPVYFNKFAPPGTYKVDIPTLPRRTYQEARRRLSSSLKVEQEVAKKEYAKKAKEAAATIASAKKDLAQAVRHGIITQKQAKETEEKIKKTVVPPPPKLYFDKKKVEMIAVDTFRKATKEGLKDIEHQIQILERQKQYLQEQLTHPIFSGREGKEKYEANLNRVNLHLKELEAKRQNFLLEMKRKHSEFLNHNGFNIPIPPKPAPIPAKLEKAKKLSEEIKKQEDDLALLRQEAEAAKRNGSGIVKHSLPNGTTVEIPLEQILSTLYQGEAKLKHNLAIFNKIKPAKPHIVAVDQANRPISLELVKARLDILLERINTLSRSEQEELVLLRRILSQGTPSGKIQPILIRIEITEDLFRHTENSGEGTAFTQQGSGRTEHPHVRPLFVPPGETHTQKQIQPKSKPSPKPKRKQETGILAVLKETLSKF